MIVARNGLAVTRATYPGLAVLAALVGLLFACGGSDSQSGSPTVVLGTVVSKVTATPTPPPSPAGQVGSGFVYREFGPEADILWQADAENPQERRQIAQLSHQANYGVWPSLSPNGRFVAYAVFPPGGVDPRSDSELRLLDLASSGQQKRLAEHVILQSLPAWSPDSRAVATVRMLAGTIELIEVSVSSEGAPGEERALFRVGMSEVAGITPLGYSGNGGSFYYLQLRSGSPGAEVVALNRNTGNREVLLRLPYSSVLYPTLSPDRSKLAFVAIGCPGVCVADLSAREIGTLSSDQLGTGPYFWPTWSPDSSRVAIGHQPSASSPAAVVVLGLDGSATTLPPPQQGFDSPMSWSLDGKTLLAHSSTSNSVNQPGDTRLVAILLQTGQRVEIARTNSLSDVMSVGWLVKS